MGRRLAQGRQLTDTAGHLEPLVLQSTAVHVRRDRPVAWRGGVLTRVLLGAEDRVEGGHEDIHGFRLMDLVCGWSVKALVPRAVLYYLGRVGGLLLGRIL